jgi:hypothetical protein
VGVTVWAANDVHNTEFKKQKTRRAEYYQYSCRQYCTLATVALLEGILGGNPLCRVGLRPFGLKKNLEEKKFSPHLKIPLFFSPKFIQIQTNPKY